LKSGAGQGENRFYPPNSALVSVDHSLDDHLIWETGSDEALADYLYEVTACLDSHYGPRTSVTDAELDFEELLEEIKLRCGETRDFETGFRFSKSYKKASCHVGRAMIVLWFKEGIKPSEGEPFFEIMLD
jgi:hypothetical protein